MLDLCANVLWLSKGSFLIGDDLPLHSHDYFQFIYVLQGCAEITISDQAYVTQDDELYPIAAWSPHALTPMPGAGLHVIEVKFTVANTEIARSLSGLPTPMRMDDARVRYILENLVNEGLEKEEHYKDLINLRFLEVLILLLRTSHAGAHRRSSEWVENETLKEIHPGIHNMDGVLAYIEDNLQSDTTLDDLARIGGMSKYHFCRSFKYLYGVTPMRYLTRLRLARAKELMIYSDMNICQIADAVGFRDANYFSRIFQQNENISPSEYCKKHRSNLYLYIEAGASV